MQNERPKQNKTKKQLMDELKKLRPRIAELVTPRTVDLYKTGGGQ